MDVNRTFNFNIIPGLIYNSTAVLKLANNFPLITIHFLNFHRSFAYVNIKNVIVYCGMLLFTVECYCSLWNVIVHRGMLLFTVECYCSLWNVIVYCGMLLFAVECYCSL